MYTRFNDNTIETKFVKQLVANTQVPFISTWKPGDFAIRGMMYITKDAIWRCNHTGYPQDIMDTCTPQEHTQIIGGSYTNEELIPYFTKVGPYVFGEEYYNITGSYQSNILGYDATTHFYLGQYLRMMRDLFDLDMMPFYNCFCGEYVSDIDFDESSMVKTTKSTQFKIAAVPVKFGRTYTVAINSELPVETMLVVYGKKGIIKDLTNNLNDIIESTSTDDVTSFAPTKTYRRYLKTSFSHPFTYRTKDWHQLWNTYYRKNGKLISEEDDLEIYGNSNYDQGIGQFEKYLKLLIKVPITNSSSLVVLEGDYTLDQFYESENTNSVTWTNQSQYDTTVNNKVVTGQWIVPEVIKNYDPVYTTSKVCSYADGTEHIRTFVYSMSKDKYTENPELRTLLNALNLASDEGFTSSLELAVSSVNDDTRLLSPLGLLQISDGNMYAFSNRLIEYLLQNVINPLELFGENITRIQLYSKSYENVLRNHTDRYTGAVTPGVWDDELRKYLFELTLKTNYLTTKVDLTGYVDKDTERIITRGLKV